MKDYRTVLSGNPSQEELNSLGITEENLGAEIFYKLICDVDSGNLDSAVQILECRDLNSQGVNRMELF